MRWHHLHAVRALRARFDGVLRLALAVGLCSTAAIPASAAQVRDVRVGRHPTFTRVVFEFDERAGYKIERGADGKSVVVKLEASATSRSVSSKAELVHKVELAPSGNRAVARIHVAKSGLSVKEMMLPSPPRIVLDFLMPDAAAGLARSVDAGKSAKAKPVATKSKPAVAQKPKSEPVKVAATQSEKVAPTPAPRHTEKTAPATKTEHSSSVAAESHAKPVEVHKETAPAMAQSPVDTKDAHTSAVEPQSQAEHHESEPAKHDEAKTEAPLTLSNKTLEDRGELARPESDLEEFKKTVTEGPLVDTDPEELPEAAQATAIASTETAPGAEKLASEPAPESEHPAEAAPTQGAAHASAGEKHEKETAPGETQAGDAEETPGGGLPWLAIAAGAGVLALLGGVAFRFMRRRPLPNDDDVIEPLPFDAAPDDLTQPESGFDTALGESSAEGAEEPLAADQQFPFGGEGFAGETDSESEREPMPPATSLFDDEDEKGDLPMEQMEAPLGGGMRGAMPRMASVGGDSDLARVVAELERRLAQAEQRMQEQADTIQRLERDVASQHEELRVQRAAIARTQRALRSMSRTEEEQATEPALREPR